MEKNLNQITRMLAQIDRRQVQLVLLVLTLALFVVGAGAPGALGDYRMNSLIQFLP